MTLSITIPSYKEDPRVYTCGAISLLGVLLWSVGHWWVSPGQVQDTLYAIGGGFAILWGAEAIMWLVAAQSRVETKQS